MHSNKECYGKRSAKTGKSEEIAEEQEAEKTRKPDKFRKQGNKKASHQLSWWS